MTIDEMKALIDYFVSSQSVGPALVMSVLAVLVSISAIAVSYYTFLKRHETGIDEYLSTIWNDVIDICLNSPSYLDITKTEHYFRVMNNDDVLKYEAYCYKVWTHVEDIVKNKKQNDEQYKAIIRWVSTYHYTWLRRNPAFFNAEEFWETVESIRTKPQMVFGYRRLLINDNYFSSVTTIKIPVFVFLQPLYFINNILAK